MIDIKRLKYEIIKILKDELPLGHADCEPECGAHYWEVKMVWDIANKICQYVTEELE